MVVFACFVVLVKAQTTAFTYQGRLADNAGRNSTYQMRFKLFDTDGSNAQNPGTQIGNSIDALVTVTNGSFNVKLDFGALTFNTVDTRFLQFEVRSNANESYVALTPRQKRR